MQSNWNDAASWHIVFCAACSVVRFVPLRMLLLSVLISDLLKPRLRDDSLFLSKVCAACIKCSHLNVYQIYGHTAGTYGREGPIHLL